MNVKIIMAAAGAALAITGSTALAAAAPDTRMATSSHGRIEAMIRNQDRFHARMRANEVVRKTYALRVSGQIAANERANANRLNR